MVYKLVPTTESFNRVETTESTKESPSHRITAGEAHTCALKTDGTVVCWGNNDYEQSTVPNGLDLGSPDPLPPSNDPVDNMDELRTAIMDMALPGRIENTLLNELKKVDKKKDLAGSCRQLDHFAKKVNEQLKHHELTAEQATLLLDAATAIKTTWGCS